MDLDTFLSQPMDVILRASKVDPRYVMGDQEKERQVREAIASTIRENVQLTGKAGGGYAKEAFRVSRLTAPAEKHLGSGPDQSQGRAKDVYLSTGQVLWVYENDIPDVFAIEDVITALKPKLMDTLAKIAELR